MSSTTLEYHTSPPRYTYAQPTYAQPTYAQPSYAPPRYAVHTYAAQTYAKQPYAKQPYAKQPYVNPSVFIINNQHSVLADDARCCGLCYLFGSETTRQKKCECCPVDLNMYCISPYIRTESGYGNSDHNGCCTCFCFPIKFPLTFICCLGSAINECMNGWCNTLKLNYLF